MRDSVNLSQTTFVELIHALPLSLETVVWSLNSQFGCSPLNPNITRSGFGYPLFGGLMIPSRMDLCLQNNINFLLI